MPRTIAPPPCDQPVVGDDHDEKRAKAAKPTRPNLHCEDRACEERREEQRLELVPDYPQKREFWVGPSGVSATHSGLSANERTCTTSTPAMTSQRPSVVHSLPRPMPPPIVAAISPARISGSLETCAAPSAMPRGAPPDGSHRGPAARRRE